MLFLKANRGLGVKRMILALSEKATCFFIAHGMIESEDREVYYYSFQILFSTLLSFSAVLALSLLTGTVVETSLYFIAFVPLRQAAGGYHAGDHFRCFLILIASYLLFLAIVRFMPSQYISAIFLICLPATISLVFKLSPLDDPNKPFTESERVRFKKKSRMTVIGYAALLIFMFVFVSNKVWMLSLLLGILSVALSLFASALKKGGLFHG